MEYFRSETTATLLMRVRQGDEGAREKLCRIYLPLLRRWAHGRLPQGTRSIAETDDMVQVTLMRALGRLEKFNPRREGAFLAYLRRVLLNAVRDEARKINRTPEGLEMVEEVPEEAPTALETVIDQEQYQEYERALTQLTEEQREAVILRFEFGFSFQEIAAAINRNSADAARMLVSRSLVKLSQAIK